MSVKSHISGVLSYLASVSNPSLFLYRTFHYINRDMPLRRAHRIYERNRSDFDKDGFNCLSFTTYDGSGQLVHPDAIKWRNTVWLVGTPYPYGMEEYENPCIYRMERPDKFVPHTMPVCRQVVHRRGTHLSDPVFVTSGDSLYCVFRSTVDRRHNRLLYSLYDPVSDKWNQPSDLYSRDNDMLLSPAFVTDGSVIMFHADWKDGRGHLYKTVFDDRMNVVDSSCEVNIRPVEEGYSIWHLSVTMQTAGYYKGLFLLKNLYSGCPYFRLFKAESRDGGDNWELLDEVNYPDEIKRVMRYPHKSCLLPESDDILLCFLDSRSRYRITKL